MIRYFGAEVRIRLYGALHILRFDLRAVEGLRLPSSSSLRMAPGRQRRHKERGLPGRPGNLTGRGKSCLMKRMRPSVETIAESDAIAVEQTLAGDRDAFRVLVEKHSRNVHRLAYRMTGNQQDAEEVVQEAFLRAYQKLEQFESRANFGTWWYRIAATYAIDRMRQQKSEESHREQPARATDEGVAMD